MGVPDARWHELALCDSSSGPLADARGSAKILPVDRGLDIQASFHPLGFRYGEDMFGPEPELRRLDAIRASLRNPDCDGPDPVYAIAMHVGHPRHREELERRNLLFGVVAYAAGRLGDEPVRSQGHVHRVSSFSGWSTPEIFEIWQGRALIYMQERADDDPGRCVVIDAHPSDRVIVPPSWAHAVISAGARKPLVFGAWCDRDYGFLYDGVRAHGGLAWFPLLDENSRIVWTAKPQYRPGELIVRPARKYPELALDAAIPLYDHLEQKPDAIQWVSRSDFLRDLWPRFEP